MTSDPTTPPDDREAAEEILGGQEIVFEGAPCLALEPEAVDRIAAALSALRERAEAAEIDLGKWKRQATIELRAADKMEAERDKAYADVVAIETRWNRCRETSESRRVAFIAADARAEAAERERDKWRTAEQASLELIRCLKDVEQERDVASRMRRVAEGHVGSLETENEKLEVRLARLEGAFGKIAEYLSLIEQPNFPTHIAVAEILPILNTVRSALTPKDSQDA